MNILDWERIIVKNYPMPIITSCLYADATVDRLLEIFPQPEPDPGACRRCGAAMIIRTNRQSGERFLGCSNFPKCRYSKGIE